MSTDEKTLLGQGLIKSMESISKDLKERRQADSEEIEKSKVVIAEHRARIKDIIARRQEECDHNHIVLESPAEYGMICDFLPVRVCTGCGYAEEGWAFWRLNVSGPLPQLERKHLVRDYVKGPILTREEIVEIRKAHWKQQETQS